eukprot:c13090_g1_i1.p1 GENE.c13090_g1_i1~~c13090_g1_i1.p1  ORF type:complete len:234 (+),score=46.33 c13090_g1_i1:85-786(+)
MEWESSITEQKTKGAISIPDVSPETLEDMEFSVSVTSGENEGRHVKELVRTNGVQLLRAAINRWASFLQNEVAERHQQQLAKPETPQSETKATPPPSQPNTNAVPPTTTPEVAPHAESSPNSLQEISDTAAAADAAGMCVVGKVFEGSPAHESGLLEGDILLRVGNITRLHNTFTTISDSVLPEIQRHKGSSAHVLAWRPSTKAHVTTSVSPREWGGGGLLGCILYPYPQQGK